MRLLTTLLHLALLANVDAAAINTRETPDLFGSPPRRIRNRGYVFKTEPLLRQESFDIMYMTQNRSLLAPGYFFMTPYIPIKAPYGGQIYDMDGNLVWHAGPNQKAQDLKACDYLGEEGNHLCMHDRTGHKNVKGVWDNTYTVVRKYRTALRDSAPNGHEYNMLPGGNSYLQAVTPRLKIDYPGNSRQKKYGTVVEDGCFEEVDTKTGESMFQWCGFADNHVNLWDTDLYLNVPGHDNNTSWKAGRGTKSKPWDFFHVNSAEKYDGDYLVSSRHLDQIIKVAGHNNKHGLPSGTTIWKLGGKTNEFAMDFTFSKQHSIRVLNFTASETTVAILDNAWEGTNTPTADTSSGKIIKINNETMTATLLRQYDHPQKMLAEGQGATQVLPNGNMLIGWGRIPDISEYTEDGELLYYARFQTESRNRSDTWDAQRHGQEASYRSVKYPWVGKPKTKPKLLAQHQIFRRNSTCAVRTYVSWNGATEVKEWRLSTSSARQGPWVKARTVPRSGFETNVCLQPPTMHVTFRGKGFVKVEGLDADGNVLGSNETSYNTPYSSLTFFALFFGFVESLCYAYGALWQAYSTP